MVLTRRFENADAQLLADLLMEMTGFYGATVAPSLVVAQDVMLQARTIDIVVAHEHRRLVGFATFKSLYPVAGLLAFTYVQQVYVGKGARRLGVARALMAEVARAAKANGSTRIEWSTGAENLAAQALYDGLGAKGSATVHYVLDGEALDRLAVAGGVAPV